MVWSNDFHSPAIKSFTMTQQEFINKVEQMLGFVPTDDQTHALQVFACFLADRGQWPVMVLRGSAGTGKTSVAAAIIKTLARLGQKMVLLAPTGRAAKVLSVHCGLPALTIHRKIYRERAFVGGGGHFQLNDNLHADTLFVVDESSMIANQGAFESVFGSGRLLDDLMRYVYGGRNCRLLLIGDAAQLPPVGETASPALRNEVLQGYGLVVYESDMDQVLRQSSESGILYNATLIRRMITHDGITELPRIKFAGFADIRMLPGNELVEALEASYREVGEDETMVVVRSNKRAKIYNLGIRNMVLGCEEELVSGDLLMVVKNHYAVLPETKGGERPPFDFIANGDRCRVVRVRGVRELYGFRFADVWLRFPDYGNYEWQVTVILDSLLTESPALTAGQTEQLFERVLADYAELPRKADRMRSVREDRYYNALQVKFAYAVTCHKAQGGQWSHVYIDQGYMTDEMLTPDYIRWLYTAFTRATDCLYLVNWPDNQVRI